MTPAIQQNVSVSRPQAAPAGVQPSLDALHQQFQAMHAQRISKIGNMRDQLFAQHGTNEQAARRNPIYPQMKAESDALDSDYASHMAQAGVKPLPAQYSAMPTPEQEWGRQAAQTAPGAAQAPEMTPAIPQPQSTAPAPDTSPQAMWNDMAKQRDIAKGLPTMRNTLNQPNKAY